jgi:chemotaxis protein histidine kinase CheA
MLPTTIETCPVVEQAETVLEQSKTLRAAINKLRRDLHTCEDCARVGECQALRTLNSQIDAAIEALSVEWGLT